MGNVETPNRSGEWFLYSSTENGFDIWARWNGTSYEYRDVKPLVLR